MATSSIVIKVKLGDTLRRFNALIHRDELNFDMIMLREKIRNLFGLTPDVDFTLTYIDEDGDAVTLSDDDDLYDVATQSLDPLRITVRLDTDKLGRSYVRSSGSSTPLRSPQDQPLFQALNSWVSDNLKSLPEPLHDALSTLSLDLASKAASSSPVLAELMEKMKMIYLNKLSESQAGLSSSTHSGTTPENTTGASNIKDQQGSKIDGASEKLPGTNSEVSTVKEHKILVDADVGSSNSKNKAVQLQTVTEGTKFGDYLNIPYSDLETFQYLVDTKDVKGSGSGKKNCCHAAYFFDNSAQAAFDVDCVLKNEDTVAGVEKKKENISIESPAGVHLKSVGFGASNPDYLKHCLQDSKMTETAGFPWLKTTMATNDSSSSSGWQQGMLSAINECPFTGMPLSSDSTVHTYPYAPRVPPFKRSYNHGNGLASIFHMGISCDGCGVHPITGPRFKSKVKDDYDLCSICFEGMGRDADYIRMDHPVIPRHSSPLKGFHDPSVRVPPLEMKPSRSKLDSRFILDVNVLDGTIMAPSTTFTKIWRMRNNGNIIWPQGSQLLWIGGDRLSNTVSVSVEIPPDGLPVGQELNIAVDFTAPELPGRYVSYWSMASPSGQKFGQRVWVLIQVDASMKDSGETSINLNLPPVSNDVKDPEVVNPEMDQDSVLCKNNFISVVESEDLFFDAQPKDQEMNFPINDTLIIGNDGVLNTTATRGAANPTMNFPEVLPMVPDKVQLPPTVVQVQPPVSSLDQEQTLLRELEEMGFKQAELNKEILRMNEYNLEQSVHDLCGVLEWDPILDELQEMGFSDEETNKRLLKKNNGSIKRVVMDLINGEMA